MPRDLRLVLLYTTAALLLAVLLSLTGILSSPLLGLRVMVRDGHTIHDTGSLGLHLVLMLLCVRPGLRAGAFIVILGSAINAGLLWANPLWGLPVSYWINSLGFGYAAASLALLGYWVRRGSDQQRRLASSLLGATAVLTAYVLCIEWYLILTSALHPLTFDVIAYKMDGALGFQPSVVAAALAQSIPYAPDILFATYKLLPYGFSILYALHLRHKQPAPASMFVIFTVSATCALLLYHLCPIAGPRYAFGVAFPLAAPDPGTLPLLQSLLAPAARNGMPSWHVGWALILWLNARDCNPAVRAGFAVFLLLTILATLGTGEHYLVDVIAGFPAAIAVQAACSRELAWGARERWRAVAAAGALVLAWIAAVRWGAAAFVAIPGFMWAAVMATGIASVLIYGRFARDVRTAGPLLAQPERMTTPLDAAARRDTRHIAAMFAISGFAALVYQVLFSKSLALTFGSQATATYSVLSVYMGGMALGAWLGGRIAQGRSDPLKLYAWCELGIGAYCLATPLVFGAIQWLYVAAAQGQPPDAAVLTALRVVLGVAALAVPTVLMGMTLPILARFFERRADSLGGSVALLYGMNTLGAAFGALLAGYLVIPALGVWKTTLAAALMNFLVVWLALRLQAVSGARAAAAEPTDAPPVADERARSLGYLALVMLGVGGIITLALEVNYIHLLAVVAGNSVYAFSLMLFAFLLGLGAGAEGARWLLRLRVSLPLALAWLQFALAAVVLGGVFLWQGLPDYFASYAGYPMAREFGAREVVRGVVCFTAMFPPAFVIGALYPLAMECVGRTFAAAPIAALGRAAALNTAGNIAGVLAAGFWLLPTIGALRSVQLLALLAMLLGVAAMAWTAQRSRPFAWAPAVLAVLLLAAQPRSFDYTALASGANVYFSVQGYGRVIDHAESVDGGLTTVAASPKTGGGQLLTLLTNGKFQGNNAKGGEMVAQVGIALSPLLHTDRRGHALVIGYGTGVSARILREAGFRELEIADLSADIVRLADRHFGDVNDGVSRREGVRTFITDGRNLLLLRDRAYDVVSLEISSIWFAGAASLYNREFYQLVKRRLSPQGVLQQWMQLHHLNPIDLLHILGSVRAEFRYVWLYLIGGQGVIIAANSPDAAPRPAYFERLDGTAALSHALRLYEGKSGKLRGDELLDPDGIDRFLGGFGVPPSQWVSTDDNLFLEYSTPKGNVLDGFGSRDENIALLRKFSVPGKPASSPP